MPFTFDLLAELGPKRPSVRGTDLFPPLLSRRRDRPNLRAGAGANAIFNSDEGQVRISRLSRQLQIWLR